LGANATILFLIAPLYLLAAMCYPASVAWVLKGTPQDRERWLKNTPTFVLYLPFLFSIGAGLLFATFPWEELASWKAWQFGIGGAILAAPLYLGGLAALEDLKRPMVEPFMFRECHQLVPLERQLRAELRRATEEGKARALQVARYKALAQPFLSIGGLRERGSLCAWTSLMLNLLAAETVAFAFWYLGMVALFGLTTEKSILAAVVGLFCMWFPLRLYAEWYSYFYSLSHLKLYPAFWFILVAAILAYAFLAYGTGGVGEILSLGVAGLLALIGALSKFRPEWLGYLARGIEEMPPRWFVASSTLVVIAIICMVGGMLRTP
jgi:MFS family permease